MSNTDRRKRLQKVLMKCFFKTFNDVNISWLNKLNSHEYKIGKSEKGSVQDDTSFEVNAFFLFVKTHNCRNATLSISMSCF